MAEATKLDCGVEPSAVVAKVVVGIRDMGSAQQVSRGVEAGRASRHRHANTANWGFTCGTLGPQRSTGTAGNRSHREGRSAISRQREEVASLFNRRCTGGNVVGSRGESNLRRSFRAENAVIGIDGGATYLNLTGIGRANHHAGVREALIFELGINLVQARHQILTA